MKKSILMLVLASLALPSMAILTVDQKAKMQSALAVIHANGVNPTILSDAIQIDWTQAKYQFENRSGAVQALHDGVASGGDFVLYQGDHVFTHAESHVDYGNLGGIQSSLSGPAVRFLSRHNSGLDPSYKHFLSAGPFMKDDFQDAYSTWSDGVVAKEQQLGSKAIIREEDFLVSNYLSNDVSAAIVDNAKNLKNGIKEMGLYTAAADLGKGSSALCFNGSGLSSINMACLSFGKKFISIADQIASRSDQHYLYNGQNYYLNPANNRYSTITADGRFNGGSSEAWMINQGATWVENSLVVTANEYQNSIDTIFDVADSFIELDGILNSTEGGVSYGDILR